MNRSSRRVAVTSNRHAPQRPQRRFSAESLEARLMMAGDTTPLWQNPQDPLDVSNDGVVAARDALLVLSALANGGPRVLAAMGLSPAASSAPIPGDGRQTAGGQQSAYVDVNGDDHLSAQDGLLVIHELNDATGEEGDIVEFRLETTNLSGAGITSIQVGEDFLLRVFVEDVRDTAVDFGVFSGYLDVEYNPALASVVTNTLTYGNDYPNGRTPATSATLTNGLINEAGRLVDLIPSAAVKSCSSLFRCMPARRGS
jgi:hypothetical protein